MAPDDDPSDRALIEAIRTASKDLDTAPPHLIHRAFDLWRPRPAAAPGLLRRLSAVLRLDDAGAPTLAHGLRASAVTIRQMLFAAEGRDVDLRVSAAGDGPFELRGQVLGPDCQGAVLLSSAEAGRDWRVWASMDELGEFTFDAVPPGRYRLALLLADAEVEIPAFDVGTLPPT